MNLNAMKMADYTYDQLKEDKISDNNGKLMSSSDSIQDNWSTGWRAYKDSSKYEYDVIDLDKNYNPIAGHEAYHSLKMSDFQA